MNQILWQKPSSPVGESITSHLVFDHFVMGAQEDDSKFVPSFRAVFFFPAPFHQIFVNDIPKASAPQSLPDVPGLFLPCIVDDGFEGETNTKIERLRLGRR